MEDKEAEERLNLMNDLITKELGMSDEEILSEYELIKEKKSKLSSSKRDMIKASAEFIRMKGE